MIDKHMSDKELISSIVELDVQIKELTKLLNASSDILDGKEISNYEHLLKALKMSRNAANEVLRVVYGLEVAILNFKE